MGDWDFAACERLCGLAELTLRSRCTGAAWEIVTAQAFGLWSTAFRGNLRAAAARFPELMASARSRGDRHAETSLILSPLHLWGLPTTLQRCATTARGSCSNGRPSSPLSSTCAGLAILAQVDLYDAEFERAWEHVSYAWRMLRNGHLSRVHFSASICSACADVPHSAKPAWPPQAASRLAEQGSPRRRAPERRDHSIRPRACRSARGRRRSARQHEQSRQQPHAPRKSSNSLAWHPCQRRLAQLALRRPQIGPSAMQRCNGCTSWASRTLGNASTLWVPGYAMPEPSDQPSDFPHGTRADFA